MKAMSKMTRQGVRDLNHIVAPKKNQLEQAPELAFGCKHRFENGGSAIVKHQLSGDTRCKICGASWNWRGRSHE